MKKLIHVKDVEHFLTARKDSINVSYFHYDYLQ